MKKTSKYKLAPGTQVREEDFGLLFYTMEGPRLYFLPVHDWLDSSFFDGNLSLDEWLKRRGLSGARLQNRTDQLDKVLSGLKTKGVIIDN